MQWWWWGVSYGCKISLNDGTTAKIVYALQLNTTTVQVINDSFDFITIFLLDISLASLIHAVINC